MVVITGIYAGTVVVLAGRRTRSTNAVRTESRWQQQGQMIRDFCWIIRPPGVRAIGYSGRSTQGILAWWRCLSTRCTNNLRFLSRFLRVNSLTIWVYITFPCGDCVHSSIRRSSVERSTDREGIIVGPCICTSINHQVSVLCLLVISI